MEEYNELIDAYLRDELQGEQKIKFEEQLSNDEGLKRQFTLAYEIKQALRHDDLSSKLKFVSTLENSESNGSQKKNRPTIKILLGFLALAFLIFIVWFSLKAEQKPIVNRYAYLFEIEAFDNYIKHSTIRSNQNETLLSDKQTKAYNLFAVQSFDKAIPMLDDLWKNQHDTIALYYLGISHLGLGNMDKARQILSKKDLQSFENPIKD